MDQLKCIVVDDELNAIKNLSEHIARIPELEFSGGFIDPLEALSFVRKTEVYLVFLDISMEALSGLDLAKIIQNKIIFTTGHKEFALQSYDLDNVVDYLIKPIFHDRFTRAVKKATSHFLADQVSSQVYHEGYLTFKYQGATVKIDHDSILFIQASENYATVHYEGKKIVAPIPIWDLEQLLPTDKFIRVNRSHIVNKSKIVEETAKEISLLGGRTMRVGKAFHQR